MDATSQNKALNLSIIDGALSTIMGSLAGGIFLTGFALKILKAEAAQIGILASLPMFANLVQIFGSYIIEKTGKKKSLCFLGAVVSRVLWIVIVLLPFKIFAGLVDFRVWVLVSTIAVSSLFGSLSGVGWLAWMSELVPENIRGTYFGKRNMIASACGMVVVLLGGKFITMWESKFGTENPFGFIILFAAGLLAGFLAIVFLIKIPEAESLDGKKEKTFNFAVFLQPLKDKNFLRLIFFVSSWMFAIQIAGPFYGVYMIENLKVNFSTITILGTFATFATLFMMKIWGPISDKLGNKPVIIVAGWFLILVPFIWIVAIPGKYYIPLLLAHIISGAFMAGASLSQFNILIKLSPKEGRSVYLALFAAITGFVGAIAPIAGGALAKIFANINCTIFSYQISNLHLIFICSAILQALTIFFILKVKEPAASTPVAVVMQLKNDLNPQTGITSVTDFVMVEVERSESILRQVDNFTEELAAKSESKVDRIFTKVGKFLEKPISAIKKFFSDKEE